MTVNFNATMTDANFQINRTQVQGVVSALVDTALTGRGAMIPVGLVQAYAGKGIPNAFSSAGPSAASFTGIPAGWLPCDGRAISQTQVADARLGAAGMLPTATLFGVIDHAFERRVYQLDDVPGQPEDRLNVPFHGYESGNTVYLRQVNDDGVALPGKADAVGRVTKIDAHTFYLTNQPNTRVNPDPADTGYHWIAFENSTFRLPDLRGRMLLGSNRGTDSGFSAEFNPDGSTRGKTRLAERLLGSFGGDEQPQKHRHHLFATNPTFAANTPHITDDTVACFEGRSANGSSDEYRMRVSQGINIATLGLSGIADTGQSGNMPPFQAMHYIIKA